MSERRGKVGLQGHMVTLALWLLVGGFVWRVLLRLSGAVDVGSVVTWGAALLLCGAGIPTVFSRIPRALALWTTGTGIVVGVMILSGLANPGEFDSLDVIRQSIPWLCFCVVPLLGEPSLRPRILRTLAQVSMVGVAINLGVLTSSWALVSDEFVRRSDLFGAVKSGQFLLFPIPWLTMQIRSLSLASRSVAVIGMAQLLYIGLASATRQTVSDVAIVVLLATWVGWRSEVQPAARIALARWLFWPVVAVVTFATGQILAPSFLHRVEQTEERFVDAQSGSGLRENARWAEAALVWEQLNGFELLLGRGVVGVFDNQVVPQNHDYVHVGYMHALLKGGVPLAAALIAGPLLAGLRVLVLARSPADLADASMCFWVGVKLVGGNILSVNPTYLLALMCLGTCLRYDGHAAGGVGAAAGTVSRPWDRRR